MKTPMDKKEPAVEMFGQRKRSNRVLLVVVLLTTSLHALAYWHLAERIGRKPEVLVMDSNTLYLPKALDFSDARDLHESQAVLVMESVMDRSPGGLDHPERLKRLCEKRGYEQAIRLVKDEDAAFSAKRMHQKFEMSSLQILQAEDDTVMVAVEGQAIRYGEFGDGSFSEALQVKARLVFIRNPSLIRNGSFPTLLKSMELQKQPLP